MHTQTTESGIKAQNNILVDGDKIRNLRQNMGMSQAEFAEACLVRQSTVSRWERGEPIYGPAVLLLERMMHDLKERRRFAYRKNMARGRKFDGPPKVGRPKKVA